MTMYRIVATELEGVPVPTPMSRTFVMAPMQTDECIIGGLFGSYRKIVDARTVLIVGGQHGTHG